MPDNPIETDDTLFLPDFCNIQVVFAVVIISELLAFVLALGPGNITDRWSNLSLISLFIQWVALSSTGLLCLLRPHMKKLTCAQISLTSFLLVITVTGLLSEAAYLISKYTALHTGVSPQWRMDFLLHNLTISAIIAAIALRYFYVQHQLQRKTETQAQARIEALQARIRPHFLFNSMNTIASLTRSQPALAEEVVEDLADLFRVSLNDSNETVRLSDELELTRRYLNIEKLRLGKRLDIKWSLQDIPDDVMVPSLIIQPLLENAIYHGIEPLPDSGSIEISGKKNGKQIEIVISNPIDKDRLATRRSSNHMALQNIRERLELHFGVQGGLETTQTNGRFQAKLTIPYNGSHAA